jgi:hypothetical protein
MDVRVGVCAAAYNGPLMPPPPSLWLAAPPAVGGAELGALANAVLVPLPPLLWVLGPSPGERWSADEMRGVGGRSTYRCSLKVGCLHSEMNSSHSDLWSGWLTSNVIAIVDG